MSSFVELMALRAYAELRLSECNTAISKLDKISRNQLAKIKYKEKGKTREDWEWMKNSFSKDLENIDKKLDSKYFVGHIIDE